MLCNTLYSVCGSWLHSLFSFHPLPFLIAYLMHCYFFHIWRVPRFVTFSHSRGLTPLCGSELFSSLLSNCRFQKYPTCWIFLLSRDGAACLLFLLVVVFRIFRLVGHFPWVRVGISPLGFFPSLVIVLKGIGLTPYFYIRSVTQLYVEKWYAVPQINREFTCSSTILKGSHGTELLTAFLNRARGMRIYLDNDT